MNETRRNSAVHRVIAALAIGIAAAAASSIFAGSARATPIYAARAGHACNTCHVEPVGWKNPPLRDRKCTLDCMGCHVSPTGGGLRTASGEYFGKETLPLLGDRPSRHASVADAATAAARGRFRLWEGFTGWVEGDRNVPEIADRYGPIAPNPRLKVGGDVRIAGYFPQGDDAGEGGVFPMQTDLYVMGRPKPHLTLYGSVGLRPREPDEEVDWIDYFAARELFVQTDRHPYGFYARVGRFNKPHGWRTPDHTTFVRREEGFDQGSQAFGAEAGFSANYPYGNLAVYYQGFDAWPSEELPKGYGAAATGGVRWLSVQLGASAQFLDLLDGGHEYIVGPLWALNAYPVVYLGEIDFRSRLPEWSDQFTTNSVYAYHELHYSVGGGVALQLKYDWLDGNIRLAEDHRHRVTTGVEWNPYTRVQILLQSRWNYLASERTSHEIVTIAHLWF